MDPIVVATIGANLEKNFYKYSEYGIGQNIELNFSVPGSESTQTHNLHVVDVLQFDTNDTLFDANGNEIPVTGPKAIAFQDEAGNIFVHFNGTGDGKWGYNATNYGGAPSEVQTDSLEFFNSVVKDYYEGQATGNLYVSGHSQGGNTAQYVTINSPYGEYIDTCISLDGPGFSENTIEAAKNKYGEAYFERQREKIYGYYGEYDYVSPLGQVQLVPEDHVTYIDNTGGDYHAVSGMMDGSSLNPIVEEDTAFRRLVVSLNQEILANLPPEQQIRGAELAMKFAESFLGNGETGENLLPVLTEQDLQDFKELLLPFLIEYLSEHPEMIRPALEAIGMSPETAELAERILLEFNDLPEDQREDALNGFTECLTVTEDGQLTFTADVWGIISGIALVAPALLEAIAKDPATVISVLKEYGILDKIETFVMEHPLATVAITVFVALNLGTIVKFVGSVIAVVYMIEAIYAIVEKLTKLGEDIKNFVLNALQAIKEAVSNIKEYLHSLTPGVKYVSNHPYFKADPVLLRSYANRLSSVNSRLLTLDRDLNDLYWQVGLLDILDILNANLITGYSVRVLAAKTYLNSAADRLEAADNQVFGYMGG